ncbi:response regulator transcription factor [Paenibacillus oenotherae]|uniref:Response regulator transcription factor n=1 Tax=Paenibacillus oenotherae TaxID=1435645 RepID=A0ABS7DB18_9BACL|nr:response regulator transcription factor [Paenibacillus oenotherae]MBW7477140.1 response regulator transcription factor [Paenibacillus oenotherae]
MVKEISILVVEDDNDINQLLCSIVRKSGYQAQPAFSGTEALLYVEKQEWQMILLDLMLPGLTGEELLARIGEQRTFPILIISAKGEQQTKIDTLRAGADDYITKPFDIEEVSARIDSHLRRYQRTGPIVEQKLLRHKDIVIDVDEQAVTVGGSDLVLTAREYSILTLMMASPRKVFTKANLFESIWGEEFISDDNTLNVHISNLRSKLAKANPQEEYIETIWGMGYRLKA